MIYRVLRKAIYCAAFVRDSELFKDLKRYFVFHVKERLCAFKGRAGVQLTTVYKDNDL